jgi:hypothetical protein
VYPSNWIEKIWVKGWRWELRRASSSPEYRGRCSRRYLGSLVYLGLGVDESLRDVVWVGGHALRYPGRRCAEYRCALPRRGVLFCGWAGRVGANALSGLKCMHSAIYL